MSKELTEQLREAAIYGPCPCPIADVAADRIEELERQLAAALAACKVKDEALRAIKYETDIRGNNLNRPIRAEAIKALAATPDDALAAVVERVKEKCAAVCDEMVLYTGFDCGEAIRNLKVTL